MWCRESSLDDRAKMLMKMEMLMGMIGKMIAKTIMKKKTIPTKFSLFIEADWQGVHDLLSSNFFFESKL